MIFFHFFVKLHCSSVFVFSQNTYKDLMLRLIPKELLFLPQKEPFEVPIIPQELRNSRLVSRQVLSAMFDGEQLPCCSYFKFCQYVLNLSNLVLAVLFRKTPWKEHS